VLCIGFFLVHLDLLRREARWMGAPDSDKAKTRDTVGMLSWCHLLHLLEE